jgi:hypothetical protein
MAFDGRRFPGCREFPYSAFFQQRRSPPRSIDYDRNPRGAAHSRDLAGTGEQTFEIQGIWSGCLRTEQRELPGH